MPDLSLRCTAFAGPARIASGELRHVALKARLAHAAGARVLVFEDASGRQVDLPLELPEGELLRQLSAPASKADSAPAPVRGPGRPKLGVVAREVTLLPRHWDWLAAQPGGASVALRKLVHEARRSGGDRARTRQARDRAYHAMSTLAGDLAGFEEASRALFAGDHERLVAQMATWPEDVQAYVHQLAEPAPG